MPFFGPFVGYTFLIMWCLTMTFQQSAMIKKFGRWRRWRNGPFERKRWIWMFAHKKKRIKIHLAVALYNQPNFCCCKKGWEIITVINPSKPTWELPRFDILGVFFWGGVSIPILTVLLDRWMSTLATTCTEMLSGQNGEVTQSIVGSNSDPYLPDANITQLLGFNNFIFFGLKKNLPGQKNGG